MIVELKPEEWNVVINTVAQAPYNQVANIVNSIVSQLQAQQAQAQQGTSSVVNTAAAGNGSATT